MALSLLTFTITRSINAYQLLHLTLETGTLNPQPSTLNPQLPTLGNRSHPKPETLLSAHRENRSHPTPETLNPKPEPLLNSQSETRNPTKPETRNPKPETRNPNPKPETLKQAGSSSPPWGSRRTSRASTSPCAPSRTFWRCASVALQIPNPQKLVALQIPNSQTLTHNPEPLTPHP